MTIANERWLVLETSGRQGRVALAEAEGVQTRTLPSGRRHARDLTLVIDEMLRESAWSPRDLAGVIASQGPGSYTGLRVGCMAAKTFAYALGCRLVAVETFAVIAAQSPGEAAVEVIADAQQEHVYCQSFGDEPRELRILPLAEWAASLSGRALVTGPGVDAFAEKLPSGVRLAEAADRHPRPETLYRLGRGAGPAAWGSLEPIYLRGSYAEEKEKADRERAAEGGSA